MSDPNEVRPAATVLVLRDAPAGLELLMLKRASKLAFYGGAWVFPGGRVETEDGDLERALPEAARRAAVRELYEEAGLRVQASDLACFARWVTPPGRARRFDTFYFAVGAPDSPVRVDPSESDDHAWLTPSAALAARARAELELPPPTFVTLSILERATSAADGFVALGTDTTHYIPKAVTVADGSVYLYAGDAGYDSGDPEAPGARHRLWAVRDGWRYER
ncbi:MAG TPA: NUDIX hydrolase [Polyangiales bacterium]|nr:NUDIX hydrolase [Polyangiales bacterium]